MVERFNRRLSEAMHALPPARANSRRGTRSVSHADRERFLIRFVADYNRTRPRCLTHKPPLKIPPNPKEDKTIVAVVH